MSVSKKLKVVATLPAAWRTLYDVSAVVKGIEISLARRNLLSNVDVTAYRVNDELKEFSDVVKGADVLLLEPDLFEWGASILCAPDCSLKFIQSYYAGVEQLMQTIKAYSPPVYPVARMSGIFAHQLAEYVIGHIICNERRFKNTLIDQSTHCWDKNKYIPYRCLNDLTIGILGLGDIGNGVAKYCKSLGMMVWGMTRSEVPLENRVSYVDKYIVTDRLTELLATSDYVCNILPSTSETNGLLDIDGFKSCANKKSVFINIGRGSVVTESTLVKAIKNGWLSGVILDVFEKEPLPKTSELWDLPEVTITPHVSGSSFVKELPEIIADQIDRYLKGESLKYVINWNKQY